MTPLDAALTIVLLGSQATQSDREYPTIPEDIVAPESIVEPVEAVTEEPEDDICDNITGYNPACYTGTPVQWIEFGTARPITYSGAQFGSDGTSSKQFYSVPAAGVLVHDMKMSNEAVEGRLSFGPAGNINGVSLRLWISSSPDGNAVSAACSYVGYAEASMRFSTDGTRACNLAPGGQYYMNLALCASPGLNNDRYCSPESRAPENGHRLVMSPDYYRN